MFFLKKRDKKTIILGILDENDPDDSERVKQ